MRRTVLLVEDEERIADVLAEQLGDEGLDVRRAHSLRQALRMLDELVPDVAVIDIGLPEIDGYEVAARIRRALGPAEIFLVALTGYADGEARQRAIESGFDAHVSKPVDFGKLSSLLAVRVAAAGSATPQPAIPPD